MFDGRRKLDIYVAPSRKRSGMEIKMTESNKSIVPAIEAKYDSMTQSEKRIAEFFITNREDGDFTIKELSNRIFVSEASISRFAKKCGFDGYREFLYRYKESLRENKEEVALSTRTVMDTYQDLLNRTCCLMDEAQIARIIQYMNRCKRVIACGIGSSGLAVSEMESRFMRIGVDIDSLQDADRMKMQAIFMDEDSLVFGFSISGQTEPVLYLLKEAHSRGAKTVFITTHDRNCYKEFCDEVVLTAYSKYLETGSTVSPQFPLLLMIDVIYNEYVDQDRNHKIALHGDTLRALQTGRDGFGQLSASEPQI